MVNEVMSNEIALLAIFLLSIFVGFEVVSKVSTTLHTPLMSGANAIHGVILVGAIVVADHAKTNLELGLGSCCCYFGNDKYGWWFCGYRSNVADV